MSPMFFLIKGMLWQLKNKHVYKFSWPVITCEDHVITGKHEFTGENLSQSVDDSLEEMDKYKSAGGHVSYLNNLADKTIGCYLASVSIEDTIEILVIGKMKGLHHRAKFTLPEPTKTLAIKDYPLTMFDKVTWPVLGILAIDKGRHAVPWACDTLGVNAKQISSALKGNNIKG
ncbi:hypothetical protein VOLCADRAFT_93097 [Volvox carteri f. nagariensis]|uniref:Uncharacterized protein n=1 Tax=Volvox carteri f. nagariensis TaxID=3068 RepID=D8U1C1_VOLCA|nr:uncharacterized protein VOLCADRAFT_93097 [Volvox carteri f. nagariensis]XP_002959767.1 uncharacterized protein VOLCADRAFT_101284 [Volvox carteri f. nagariensis]EFJ39168.1 hypothetical protein VOLCADRAFT_101284 [Volvox carteri f. nagariensis]EFJ46609.1 hypothetical protein VOLCADRAFT_93097 [Volvox carteri f. nagariensis]|eukprot:XP_002952466.1 hypothetical protein VOLCADRAFT_93097 [Volvox carteri f. nagariensis]